MKPAMGRGLRGRRSFLRHVAGTSALLLSHRGLGLAEVLADEAPVGPPVGLGVVGLGAWGREILSTLARMPSARVVAVCDRYAAALLVNGPSWPSRLAERFPGYEGCAAVAERIDYALAPLAQEVT